MKVMEVIFLNLMFNIMEIYISLSVFYYFWLKERNWNFVQFVPSLHDKNEYFINIRNLKRALKHGLVLKKVHRIIKFNQKACLKLYIDISIDLRTKVKTEFKKYYLKLMNNLVFEETLGNVRKHKDTKLVTTETRNNYLVLEPNYNTK